MRIIYPHVSVWNVIGRGGGTIKSRATLCRRHFQLKMYLTFFAVSCYSVENELVKEVSVLPFFKHQFNDLRPQDINSINSRLNLIIQITSSAITEMIKIKLKQRLFSRALTVTLQLDA